MELKNTVIVVTGGAKGIGRALCRRFHAEKPKGIVVADLDLAQAQAVADEVGGMAVQCDVADEAHVIDLVRRTVDKYGPIDLFCSNAGIVMMGDVDTDDAQWERIWKVNFMSQLYAARAVVPAMIARGRGYLLQTASAAGLLTQLASAPYSVTKHASVALAEWLAITYGPQGIKVSCLCPMGVQTDMLSQENPFSAFLQDTSVTPDYVAECVLKGIADERFLILPHPEVATFFRHKADDYDRWLRGMQRLQQTIERKWRADSQPE